MPTAQIEGAAEAISEASRHSYEAVIVALVVLAAMVALSWLVKTWMVESEGREKRMGDRITRLEDIIQQTLTTLVKESTEAIRLTSQSTSELRMVVKELHDALLQRPCLLDGEEIIDKLRKNHAV